MPPLIPAPQRMRSTVVALGLAVAAACNVASAGPLAFARVPFESAGKAAQPSITVDPAEGFIVSWQERGEATSALHFAVLDGVGGERRRGQVSTGPDRFINAADFPSLVVLDNGDWLTFWLQKTAPGTYAYEVRTTRSQDQGRTWDAPVVVHRDATPTEHGFVSMVPAGEDRVRLIWLDGRQMAAAADQHGEGDDERMTLRTAVLGRDGIPRDEQELDSLTCACCQTDMARGATLTLALYRDRSPTEIRDIGVITFSDTGPAKQALLHNDGWKMPGCPVNGPALAVQGDDRFLAAWPTMANGPMEVRVAVGTAGVFEPPQTLAGGDSELGRLDAASLGDAGWLVSRIRTVDRRPTLTVTQLDAKGLALSEEAVLTAAGGYPRMAVSGEAIFVVATEPAAGGASRVAIFRAAKPGS